MAGLRRVFDPVRAAGVYGVEVRKANNPSPRNAAVAAADKLPWLLRD
ncbi:MAG: hypothetical protein ACK4K7_02445 [Allosphingosinicella sp.]